MRKFFFFFLAVIALISSCKQKDRIAAIADEQNRSEDSIKVKETIINFYTWYSVNYEEFMDYELYSGIQNEDYPPYKINWDEVKRYQDFIRRYAPHIGDEFLFNQQSLFKKCDSAFKADPDEEMPYYFDFDWYTNTQEDPQYMLDEMRRSQQWRMYFDSNYVHVDIKGYDDNGQQPVITVINLILKKDNNEWKITKIGNE